MMKRTTPPTLFEHTAESLRALLAGWDEPGYRATQVWAWVFHRGARRYADMTNLPNALRTRLDTELPIYCSTLIRRQDAVDGTVKLLLGWPDAAPAQADCRRAADCD